MSCYGSPTSQSGDEQRQRSKSRMEVEAARQETPSATAGEGLPAPKMMARWQLGDQTSRLVGSVVAYTCARDGEAAQATYAGMLSRAPDNSYVVLRSSTYNYVVGTVPHLGADEQVPLPAIGWTYSRIISAVVHQTEKAGAELAGVRAELASAQQEVQRLRESELPSSPRPELPSSAWPSVKHPASAADVREWGQQIAQSPELLLAQLESRLLSGLTHLSGGPQLKDAFEAVRLWVHAAGWFLEWAQSPHADLGNHLFTRLLLQFEYVHNGKPRRAIEGRMAEKDVGAHVVTRVAAGVVRAPARGRGYSHSTSTSAPTSFGHSSSGQNKGGKGHKGGKQGPGNGSAGKGY